MVKTRSASLPYNESKLIDILYNDYEPAPAAARSGSHKNAKLALATGIPDRGLAAAPSLSDASIDRLQRKHTAVEEWKTTERPASLPDCSRSGDFVWTSTFFKKWPTGVSRKSNRRKQVPRSSDVCLLIIRIDHLERAIALW